MDEAKRLEAREAQIRDCPNCARFERLKRRSKQNFEQPFNNNGYQKLPPDQSEAGSECDDLDNVGLDLFETDEDKPRPKSTASDDAFVQMPKLHTRHMSINVASMGNIFGEPSGMTRSGSLDRMPPPIDENTPFVSSSGGPSSLKSGAGENPIEIKSDDSYSSSSTSTESSSFQSGKPLTRGRVVKYIFLTLKQALINSSFIIAGGSLGFYYIEDMSAVDSFYFTTVLLTSVGYGDIVPLSDEGAIRMCNCIAAWHWWYSSNDN